MAEYIRHVFVFTFKPCTISLGPYTFWHQQGFGNSSNEIRVAQLTAPWVKHLVQEVGISFDNAKNCCCAQCV